MRSAVASTLMAVNDYIITGNGKYRDDYERYARLLDSELRDSSPLAGSAEERNALKNMQAEVN